MYHYPIQNIFQLVRELNVKSHIIKTLEDNIYEYLFKFSKENGFLCLKAIEKIIKKKIGLATYKFKFVHKQRCLKKLLKEWMFNLEEILVTH